MQGTDDGSGTAKDGYPPIAVLAAWRRERRKAAHTAKTTRDLIRMCVCLHKREETKNDETSNLSLVSLMTSYYFEAMTSVRK